jgi:hypothetical protein
MRKKPPPRYFDKDVVDDAVYWIKKGGLVRACMFPRFMDVLLKTEWYQRALFFESLIAAEDMLCVGGMDMFGGKRPDRFVLIGNEGRCRIYDYVIKKSFDGPRVASISDTAEIDSLSIMGILDIAKRAGIINV